MPDCEAVILSTCNRVEVYLASFEDDPEQTQQRLAQFLSDFHNVPLDEFVGELRFAAGSEAVWHLYEVISSLDSMVLGTPANRRSVSLMSALADSAFSF